MSNNGYIKASVLGVEVYVDRCIMNDTELLYISCFKGAESVKGALGGFLSDSDILIDGNLYRRKRLNYRQLVHKATDGVTHGITFVESLFNGECVSQINVVFGDTKEEVMQMIYARLRKFSRVPLLDSWRNAIIKNCVEIIKLKTFGIEYALEILFPTHEELEQYVMANLDMLKQIEVKKNGNAN